MCSKVLWKKSGNELVAPKIEKFVTKYLPERKTAGYFISVSFSSYI